MNTASTASSLNVPPSAAASLFQTAKHPTTCLLHLGIKLLTLVLFAMGPWIFGQGDFAFTFVLTTVLLSMDFWVVKNLSGRLLVGLRWENVVEDDGSNRWVYECVSDESTVNPTDKTVFWTGLFLWPMIWSVLTFFYFIKLDWDWMALTIMATVLSSANLLGYWRCSTESKRKLQQLTSSSFVQSALARLYALII